MDYKALKRHCAKMYDLPPSLMEDEPAKDFKWQIIYLYVKNYNNYQTAAHYATGLCWDKDEDRKGLEICMELIAAAIKISNTWQEFRDNLFPIEIEVDE